MLTANFYAFLFSRCFQGSNSAYHQFDKYKSFLTGNGTGNTFQGNGYPEICDYQSTDYATDASIGYDRRYALIPLGNTDEYNFADVVKKNNNTFDCTGNPSTTGAVLVKSYCSPYKRSGMIYTCSITNNTSAAITINSLLLFISSSSNGQDLTGISAAWEPSGWTDLVLLGQTKLDTPVSVQVNETVDIGWAINGIQAGVNGETNSFGNDITTGQQET